jgi:hypothetical protein
MLDLISGDELDKLNKPSLPNVSVNDRILGFS